MSFNPYQLSKLISKYIKQRLSEEETLLLEAWLEESGDNRELFDRLIEVERVKKSFDYFEATDLDYEWAKANKKRSVKKGSSNYLWYAATIVGIMFSVFLSLPKNNEIKTEVVAVIDSAAFDLEPGNAKATLQLSKGDIVDLSGDLLSVYKENGHTITSNNGVLDYSKLQGSKHVSGYNTISVPKAGTYRLILADGTKVWLNSLSQLKFPVQFSKNNRKVQLTGEAYFEVAPEASRPFLVEVATNTIEVLGTHFNVNSHDSQWKTTLFEGSVKVHGKSGYELLAPGQEAVIKDDRITVQKAANLRKARAWRNNEFYFRNESIAQILLELSRWYDFEVDVKNLEPTKQFSGSINKNLKLSEVLKILKSLSGHHFYFDGKQLHLKFTESDINSKINK